jgi:hypothetical protein
MVPHYAVGKLEAAVAGEDPADPLRLLLLPRQRVLDAADAPAAVPAPRQLPPQQPSPVAQPDAGVVRGQPRVVERQLVERRRQTVAAGAVPLRLQPPHPRMDVAAVPERAEPVGLGQLAEPRRRQDADVGRPLPRRQQVPAEAASA